MILVIAALATPAGIVSEFENFGLNQKSIPADSNIMAWDSEERTTMEVRPKDEEEMRRLMKNEGWFCDEREEMDTGRIHLCFHRIRVQVRIP